jgi:hypothetical protein
MARVSTTCSATTVDILCRDGHCYCYYPAAEYTVIQKIVQQYKETATAASKEGKKLQAENDVLEKHLRKCQKQLHWVYERHVCGAQIRPK